MYILQHVSIWLASRMHNSLFEQVWQADEQQWMRGNSMYWFSAGSFRVDCGYVAFSACLKVSFLFVFVFDDKYDAQQRLKHTRQVLWQLRKQAALAKGKLVCNCKKSHGEMVGFGIHLIQIEFWIICLTFHMLIIRSWTIQAKPASRAHRVMLTICAVRVFRLYACWHCTSCHYVGQTSRMRKPHVCQSIYTLCRT